jgi:hypothetical protein
MRRENIERRENSGQYVTPFRRKDSHRRAVGSPDPRSIVILVVAWCVLTEPDTLKYTTSSVLPCSVGIISEINLRYAERIHTSNSNQSWLMVDCGGELRNVVI